MKLSMKKNFSPDSTRLYDVLNKMKYRCYDKRSKDYRFYGDRGISVCKEWLESFEAFYNWAISNGYKKGLSIDRIDSSKNYCPDNCRFILMADQGKDTRKCKKIFYNGKEYRSLSHFCEEHNIKYYAARSRFRYGWAIEDIINIEPVIGRNQFGLKRLSNKNN